MELAGFYEGNKEITPSVKIKQSTPKWIASSSRWLPWRDQEMKELWVLCAEKKLEIMLLLVPLSLMA